MRNDLGKLILHTLLVLAVTMAAVGLILWGYQRSAQVPTTMQKWAAITWIGFIAGLSVYIFLPHRLFLSRLLTALLATISGLWLLGWLAPSYGGAGLYDQPKPNWDGLVQLLFGGLIATWTLMILEYILPRKKVLASRDLPSGVAISAGMPAPAASARQPKRKSWKPWKSLEELAQKYGPNTSTHTQHEAGSVQPQPRKSAAKKKASSSGKSKPNGSSKRTRSDVPQKKTSAKKNTQVQSRNNSVPPANSTAVVRSSQTPGSRRRARPPEVVATAAGAAQLSRRRQPGTSTRRAARRTALQHSPRYLPSQSGWDKLRGRFKRIGSNLANIRWQARDEVYTSLPREVYEPVSAPVNPPPLVVVDQAVKLGADVEHRCPFCLELIIPNDPRGVRECPICHTRHHGDCWDITGVCQVPHYHD